MALIRSAASLSKMIFYCSDATAGRIITEQLEQMPFIWQQAAPFPSILFLMLMLLAFSLFIYLSMFTSLSTYLHPFYLDLVQHLLTRGRFAESLATFSVVIQFRLFYRSTLIAMWCE